MIKQVLTEKTRDEIDLMELFFKMLEHWKMILISTVLVGVIAYLYAKYLVTPLYSSTSMLYVLSKSTSITSLADIQLGSDLTNDYLVVVNGRPIVDKVIENLGLNESYDSLASRISLSNPSDSRILAITVIDTDPQRAKLIADEMADVSSAFIAEKMDQDPPSIIQYGYSDEGKISPNISKKTFKGAMVGAILSIAWIIVLFLLDDTIMTRDDVEKKLGLNFLGVVLLNEEYKEAEIKEEKRRFIRKLSRKK
jgi:capsular polysaccharide biosynthesis protein